MAGRRKRRRRGGIGAKAALGTVLLLGWALLAPSSGAGNPTVSATIDLLDKAIHHLNLAIQQAVLAQLRSSASEVHVHAQVVLNLLEGQNGPDYDASAAPDPGDGVGVIPYVERLRAEPALQGDSNESIQLNLKNVLAYLQQAVEYAKMALSDGSLLQTQQRMREALAFLSAAKGREREITVAGGLLVLRARLDTPAERPGSQQAEK